MLRLMCRYRIPETWLKIIFFYVSDICNHFFNFYFFLTWSLSHSKKFKIHISSTSLNSKGLCIKFRIHFFNGFSFWDIRLVETDGLGDRGWLWGWMCVYRPGGEYCRQKKLEKERFREEKSLSRDYIHLFNRDLWE